MSENPFFVSLPLDGRKELRFADWGNNPVYRERAIAANTHPDSAQDRVTVLPYVMRGATSALVMQYANLSSEAESRSRQWVVKHNKVCALPETVELRRRFNTYERIRAKTENSELLQKMVLIGNKLVERGVIPIDTLVWQELQQASVQNQTGELLVGFPEFLIMEAVLQSRRRKLPTIEDNIRALLDVGRLTRHFAGGFELIDRMSSTEN